MRLDLSGQIAAALGSSLQRQLEQLRKQRDESFEAREISHPAPTLARSLPPSPTISHPIPPSPTINHPLPPSPTISHHLPPSQAREIAVDNLRQRVVREGQTIVAMRCGFADAAEQLRLALTRIPLTDESLAAHRQQQERIQRQLDATRGRMTDGALERWRLRFLRAHWVGWREMLLRGAARRVESRMIQQEARSTRERRDERKEADGELRRARAEAREAIERATKLARLLDEASQERELLEDAEASAAAAAAVERAGLAKRVEVAEVAAAAAVEDAGLSAKALEQAKTMEELWFEQREALLDEVCASRARLAVHCARGRKRPCIAHETASVWSGRWIALAVPT